jgi:serine/threonine protein kinase
MSSQLRRESPDSTSRVPRQPQDASGKDPARSKSPLDDTPTIISRQNPSNPPLLEDSAISLRGRHLAHFELIEPIGVGGMAAVLRARDTQLDRIVALKILPPEMAADPENVRRFHQEARSAAKLDHENIARVFFCGEDQRLHFIAFEFVEGENLRTMLERRGRLPVREAVQYMLQVAAGLAHAAQRGVVHRDIKPSNILITPNGRAKLVDMGLARCQERKGDDLTQSGVTLGTFDYISPEQALEPRDADVRSDIYSLGCTFYHLITGQAPVPDGTAARKLHHHQHVKPLDPRELVPDLPVEVAQVLDRMMAKNPRDRYQSPEELVQHLLQLAQQLGSDVQQPDGVLSLETTSTPSAASGWPFLWTVLAIVGVLALVLLLDQLPSDSGNSASLTGSSEQVDSSDTGTRPVAVVKSEEPRQPAEGIATAPSSAGSTPGSGSRTDRPAQYILPADSVRSAQERLEDLQRWLDSNRDAATIELRLSGELELPLEGLVLTARQQIILRSHVPGQYVTLRFPYRLQAQRTLVGLNIQSPSSLIEGVRFVVNAYQTEKPMTALQLGVGQHVVRNCEFIQTGRSDMADAQLASLVALGDNSDNTRSTLTLEECVFLGYGEYGEQGASRADVGGQHAVVRRGSVSMTVNQCVFGPHQAAFRLEGGSSSDLPGTRLTVRHCTVLLPARQSAVFDFAAAGKGRLDVSHCVFARCSSDGEEGAVLLAQADDALNAVVFQGRDNRYYDLDGYWSVGGDWKQAGWTDMRRRLARGNSDELSRVLLSSPWVEAMGPRGPLARLEAQQVREAFELDPGQLVLRKSQSPGELLGATRILGKNLLTDPLPRIEEGSEDRGRARGSRILVVELSEEGDEGDSRNGVYPSLEAALPGARPGDTIRIRQDGEMELHPLVLDRKGLSELTIRSARGFAPVLTLAESATGETALFRVHEGRLRLEGLAIRVGSARSAYRRGAVVALMGQGECLLNDCLVTLQRSLDTSVALATLGEPSRLVKPDMMIARTRDRGPRLALEGCFVRGEGDLLWTRANRPFQLDIRRSLAALSGSLLHFEVSPEEQGTSTSQQVQIELQQLMTYLGGSLIRLSADRQPRGMVKIVCQASESLFVPAGTTPRSLILFDSTDNEVRASLAERFNWTGSRNAYGAYSSLLSPENTDSMPGSMGMGMGMEKWKQLTAEEKSSEGIKLLRSPPPGTRFAQMTPSQFVLPPGMTALEKLLLFNRLPLHQP